MNYSDLIDPKYLMNLKDNPDPKYGIWHSTDENASFIHFSPKKVHDSSPQEIDTNWKGRLSIHPEDMDKAWKIITQILYQKKIIFKVANLYGIETFKNKRQEKLNNLIKKYDLFLGKAGSRDIQFVRKSYEEVYQHLDRLSYSEWRFVALMQTYFSKFISFFSQYFFNEEELIARTQRMYEQLIDTYKQKVKNSLRFYEGMQFTVYIVPGHEKECQATLEEIELNLIQAQIRPGAIFPTDRQIGIYSSVRHPGKWSYHKATALSLETYNPDNINDPFHFIPTIPAEKQLQDEEAQALFDNTSPQRIINTLKTKQFISPRQLKELARHKEHVVNHIKTTSLNMKKELLSDCLDKSSNLGKFFRVQRGMFSPKLGHGTLKQLEDMLLKIT